MPTVQTPNELGLAIRARRRELGWDQATLAKQTGVTRQWVIDIEKGKPRAELGLAMRAMRVMGMLLVVEPGANPEVSPASSVESGKPAAKPPRIDIDAIAGNKGAGVASGPVEAGATELAQSITTFKTQRETLNRLVEQASRTLTPDILGYLADVQSVARVIEQATPQLTNEVIDALKESKVVTQAIEQANLKLPNDLVKQIKELDATARMIEQASQLLPRTAADYLNQANSRNQHR